MLIAYSWPLLGLFWTFLVFAMMFIVVFWIIWCFVDNFRRSDHHGWAKAGWTIFIIFVPILGALIYTIARPANL